MLKVHIARLWQKLGDDAHTPLHFHRTRARLPFRQASHGSPFAPFLRIGTSASG
jgi:hypothetical protein